ncbi:tetratricopeptide repeat protein [Chitinophaga nivalis]|uniref:Tetratricopeptide repeat protein n=1 Tax=Chitinophaga nivalis TaxID=2991709 RepID=A0ABT3IWI4_9BACT|nr:tetratricopeptide repeat protein [Chitinophaga nivalis]MCW3461994.1 tetratricopeptide repeat protein [Chitinophaga nivalis]MCW3488315.1 tetratricopeptide repeat protein [Chitinophaga nivalis]
MRSSLLSIFFFLAGVLFSSTVAAQDAKELYSTANNFIRNGDYSNAILVLNQALQLDPENFEYKKQLGFTFYLKGDLNKAKSIIEPLLNSKEADVQVFQIAGNIYKGREDWKTAQRMYARALKKFPKSGELYNDNGNLQMNFKMYDAALRSWLKGIEEDPAFPGNYYNAVKTYEYSNDPVWCILYGETFMNMESFTTRTAEVRNILLEAYKKLFNDPSLFDSVIPDEKSRKSRSGNDFIQAYRQSMGKQISVVTGGIDPDALLMVRTRFILDWFNFYGMKFPVALFDFQQQLLREGMFEAYNQWLFGPAANQAGYKAWVALHKQEYDAFLKFQRNHPLKPRPDEYYNDGRFTLANAGY